MDSLRGTCGDIGQNRVYLYPWEYISYGAGGTGLLTTRPTGLKEYKVVDHLGSTRAIVSGSGSVIGTYDNEPFGAPLAVTGVESRKGFIDKETDQETSTSNHGVRQYDAATGRFISADPLWERYLSFSPFSYSANNPLVMADRNGMSIDVIDIVLKDQAYNSDYANEIIGDLSSKTGLALYVDDAGMMQYDKSKTNTSVGSATARALLMQAIDSPDNVVAERVMGFESHAIVGGSTMRLNMESISFAMNNTFGSESGVKVNKTTYGFGMIFMHELLHTRLGPNGGLTDKGEGGIGQVEKLLNKVRSELGPEYGQRFQYDAKAFLGSGNAYIPFSTQANSDLKSGVEPQSGMYVMVKKGGKTE